MIQVLIVDDSPVMRSFIRKVISLSGIQAGRPLEAGNGQEALAVLREQSVDLILSDINMPVMNGEDFVRNLQAEESLRGIPVIVVSTDARLERVEQMMGFGARGYITKPFQPEALRAEIERVLEVVRG